MTWKKRVLLVALAAAVLGFAALRPHGGEGPDLPSERPQLATRRANRDVAVVYYSRSGHSEAVAREIARTFNAPIARIRSDLVRRTAAPDRAHATWLTSRRTWRRSTFS